MAQGVHVAHIIIDGVILAEKTKAWVAGQEDKVLRPELIADAYWFLHEQDRCAWTQELDLRSFAEKF